MKVWGLGMDYKSGWLNIDKPLGVSSAHLVAKVKRLLPHKCKIGHAGTLDPAASGVLPLAIGETTKLARFLVDAHKEYRFTIQFGAETDSGDVEGEVVSRCEGCPTEEQARAIIPKFLGEITQIPPAYSAIKINGQRAYKLARAGEMVEMPSRQVNIYKLELVAFDAEKKTDSYVAECSKGTYIRTLAQDISKSLQNLGFVIELRRLRVGCFSEGTSLSFEQLLEMKDGLGEEALLASEIILGDIPVVEVSCELAERIRHGQKIRVSDESLKLVWIRYEGQILAIGSLEEGVFHIDRVFTIEN